MNICTLNKIAACGTARFDAAKYTVTEDLSTATGVMVRSAAMHDMELPDSLLAIARAGAGVNNIPVDKCSETGVLERKLRRRYLYEERFSWVYQSAA